MSKKASSVPNCFWPRLLIVCEQLQELDTIWLNERKLLRGCCCNVIAMLFCLRVMSEIEQKAEELISKYRAQQVSVNDAHINIYLLNIAF